MEPPLAPLDPRTFAHPSVRADAEAATLSPIEAAQVRVRTEGNLVWVEVDGQSDESALARCAAVVRAGLHSFDDQADDALGLRQERRRALEQVQAIQAQLTTFPVARATLSALPAPDTYCAWAAMTADRLDDPGTPTVSLGEHIEGRALAAVQQRLVEAMRTSATLRAEGRGERHPEVVDARARQTAIESWLTQQRGAEASALRSIVEAWAEAKKDKHPKHGAWRRAIVQALASRLARTGCEPTNAVGFDAPARLQLLAFERAQNETDRAVLAIRLGELHPRMQVIRARTEAIDASYRATCADELRFLQAQLLTKDFHAPGDAADPRIKALQAEQERLISVLVALEERVDAYDRRPMRARIRQQCEVRRVR